VDYSVPIPNRAYENPVCDERTLLKDYYYYYYYYYFKKEEESDGNKGFAIDEMEEE